MFLLITKAAAWCQLISPKNNFSVPESRQHAMRDDENGHQLHLPSESLLIRGARHIGARRRIFLLVTMPMKMYTGLLRQCPHESSEYAILRNGVISQDEEYGGKGARVELLCSHVDAQSLLEIAARSYPRAARHIEKSIKLAREL